MGKKKKVFLIKAHEKVKKLDDDADIVYVYTVKAHASRINSFRGKSGNATVVVIYVEKYSKYKDMLPEVKVYAKKRYGDDFEIHYPEAVRKKAVKRGFFAAGNLEGIGLPPILMARMERLPKEKRAEFEARQVLDFEKRAGYNKFPKTLKSNADIDKMRKELLREDAEGTALFLKKCAELQPTSESYYEYALWLYDIKKYAEAKEEFIRTIEIDGEHAYAHYFLAKIYANDMQLAEAECHYRKAFEFEPEDMLIMCEYISFLDRCEKYEIVQKECRRILKNDPYNPLIRISLIRSLHKSGRMEESQEEFCRFLELEPEPDSIHRKAFEKIRDEFYSESGENGGKVKIIEKEK